MCSEEQQTSDNLIVKDNCFIIEIFDKFSFSGVLGGCFSHLRARLHREFIFDNQIITGWLIAGTRLLKTLTSHSFRVKNNLQNNVLLISNCVQP